MDISVFMSHGGIGLPFLYSRSVEGCNLCAKWFSQMLAYFFFVGDHDIPVSEVPASSHFAFLLSSPVENLLKLSLPICPPEQRTRQDQQLFCFVFYYQR